VVKIKDLVGSLLSAEQEEKTYFLVSMPDRVLSSSAQLADQQETGRMKRPKS
jgi:hypothetical protein